MNGIIRWFEMGGSIRLDEALDSASMIGQLQQIGGLLERTRELGLSENEPDAVRASAAEFILEGLYAHRRITRSEEYEFSAGERRQGRDRGADEEVTRKQRNKQQYQ